MTLVVLRMLLMLEKIKIDAEWQVVKNSWVVNYHLNNDICFFCKASLQISHKIEFILSVLPLKIYLFSCLVP